MKTLLSGDVVATVRMFEGGRPILSASIGFTLITQSFGFEAVDLL